MPGLLSSRTRDPTCPRERAHSATPFFTHGANDGDDGLALRARNGRTPSDPAVPVVERGEDRNIVRKRGRDDKRVEDLVRREEVVERPRREALRDAVRAAHPSVRPCGPAVAIDNRQFALSLSSSPLSLLSLSSSSQGGHRGEASRRSGGREPSRRGRGRGPGSRWRRFEVGSVVIEERGQTSGHSSSGGGSTRDVGSRRRRGVAETGRSSQAQHARQAVRRRARAQTN